MGANHSRNDLNLSDSDSDSSTESETRTRTDYTSDEYQTPTKTPSSSSKSPQTTSSLDDIETRLESLKLKYNPQIKNSLKLYHHIGGHTQKSKWVVSEKITFFKFVKIGENGADDVEEEGEGEIEGNGKWVLKVGSRIRVVVDELLQMKVFKEEKRVDFVANGGVWAMRFSDDEGFRVFLERYESCLFENRHGYEDNEENKVRVFGKDFIGWGVPEKADDSMWDAEDAFEKSPERVYKTPVRGGGDLREEFEEAASGGGTIQSLALGALDNSFLVSESGVQVVRNYTHGIQGKGVYVNFDIESSNGRFGGGGGARTTPRKALLMKAETNMLLMSPMSTGKPHASGLHQLDIETGSIVSEWKFEKDGTDITMRDITNDNKGAQIDPSGSTFLGLDDNRLCRWDMRDRHGIVQDIVNNESTPVLNWAQGHQFSRGTNFQSFATTGDGSIAVGSLDGKIRLYSITSMRQAKTAFPGLGSPITHIDVTFDGKWILGTTDTYLILICSLFTDKDGKTKSGFSGRMGNRISAPRLLKLNPLDVHLAGGNKFRNAQFSWVTENGKQERHLVATVGKFSVIWSFQQVKDGAHECYQNQVGLKSCYCYKIVPKDDSIVESRFMHEKYAVSDSPEAPLVVATPMKVSSFSISSSRLRL
ncbi:hypothetical protein LIER_36810 [Lithospermum erythrorhizon]|uniref:Vacuolar import/degradation Vid27 C-terminal domain-containing protein n=1 Tax=Lithospermum erythrorhizon TaxID=34254 RepID=A0AAV3PB82_LITER